MGDIATKVENTEIQLANSIWNSQIAFLRKPMIPATRKDCTAVPTDIDMSIYGQVFDETYKVWRNPTPQEYDEQLKKEAEAKNPKVETAKIPEEPKEVVKPKKRKKLGVF